MGLKQTIKIILISAIVFLVISIIAFCVVVGMSTSSALDNLSVKPEEAKEMALEHAYIYARDHYHYDGSMEAIASGSNEMNIRELVFKVPLSKCHYVYDFEFMVGNMEMDIQVNAKTGMCQITDIDRID